MRCLNTCNIIYLCWLKFLHRYKKLSSCAKPEQACLVQYSPWHAAVCLSHNVCRPLGWGCLQGSRFSPSSQAFLSAPAMCHLVTQACRKENLEDRNTMEYCFFVMGWWLKRKERMQEQSSSSLLHTTLELQQPLFRGNNQTSRLLGFGCRPQCEMRLQYHSLLVVL